MDLKKKYCSCCLVAIKLPSWSQGIGRLKKACGFCWDHSQRMEKPGTALLNLNLTNYVYEFVKP